MQIVTYSPPDSGSDFSQQYEISVADCTNYLKKILDKNRLSATQLAAELGKAGREKRTVSNSTVSNWLRGDYIPSTEHFNALARLLKIPVWLILMQVAHQIEPPFIPSNIDLDALGLLSEASDEEIKAAAAAYQQLPTGTGIKILKAIAQLEGS